jgi:hypothetical protein
MHKLPLLAALAFAVIAGSPVVVAMLSQAAHAELRQYEENAGRLPIASAPPIILSQKSKTCGELRTARKACDAKCGSQPPHDYSGFYEWNLCKQSCEQRFKC